MTSIVRYLGVATKVACAGLALAAGVAADAAPKVVLISLDGARPDLVERYVRSGVLDDHTGLGRLLRHGVAAERNVTATPSVTAVAHIAIATGSTAVHNDIGANTFHPVAGNIGASLSGFGAPIGGYQIEPAGPGMPPTVGPAMPPTAEPLWVQVREAGMQVVTATWPGSDGANIAINGTTVQAAVPTRTNDYTVPFGAFGGLGAFGITLAATDFVAAPDELVTQLQVAGHVSFSPPQVTRGEVESIFCNPNPVAFSPCGNNSGSGRSLDYDVRVAVLDSTNDGTVNYDLLVVFDAGAGVSAGPFAAPSTGPAVVRVGGPSGPFFFEGSGNVVGTAFFAAAIATDLSQVKLVRYAANYVPRNAAVLADVDDVNGSVGFWRPQPDFRIPERLSPGFGSFTDAELEAAYEDQVATFTAFQTSLALHAIRRNPDADLVMLYFEQPDGSGHQFTLTDRRQATNPLDASTVGVPGRPAGATGQDADKVARYRTYLQNAYRVASDAVEAIVQEVGVDRRGEPRSDVIVVSDHGMSAFHTAVNLRNLLLNAGFTNAELADVAIRTTGPAAHLYVNLQGRELGGTVDAAGYQALVERLEAALVGARDENDFFNPKGAPLFSHVWSRPMDCGFPGFCTDDNVGQDFGDVVGLMVEGYNFDGTQSPVVVRLGDSAAVPNPVLSVPNFYGAHGHDSELRSMSATFIAAGPGFRKRERIRRVESIDVAPTILALLGVEPAATVDGRVLCRVLDDRRQAGCRGAPDEDDERNGDHDGHVDD